MKVLIINENSRGTFTETDFLQISADTGIVSPDTINGKQFNEGVTVDVEDEATEIYISLVNSSCGQGFNTIDTENCVEVSNDLPYRYYYKLNQRATSGLVYGKVTFVPDPTPTPTATPTP